MGYLKKHLRTLELLDKMNSSELLTSEEKEELYNYVIGDIKKSRLRRFVDENYVLLCVMVLLAGSFCAVMITGYESNEMLLYCSCIANLLLCCVTLNRSMKKLEVWLLRSEEKENGQEKIS